jgi:8-oxo-dGTP pyrophosphatase MutT (NUDIX family)
MQWRELDGERIYSCSVFDVHRRRRISPEGAEGDFFVLDLPDWVTVVPVLDDSRGRRSFLMVEQYRHGSGRVTIEFPAGSVDPGEPPERAARRELSEETGYRAGKLVALDSINPNPALMNNRTHIFTASGLSLEGEQELDHGEEIRLHLVPVEEVYARMGTGRYDNAIMTAALAFYRRYEEAGRG